MGNLEIHVVITLSRITEIKEIVKMIDEIRKEYSCDCTLSVHLDN